jgi:hypothetical protein
MAGAAGITILVLAFYLGHGQFNMSQAEVDWSLQHMRGDAPQAADNPSLLLVSLSYLVRYSGSIMACIAAAAWIILCLLRYWRIALALLACLGLLVVALANSQWLVLPGSMMLYPDRAVYWGGPLAAVTMALAWHALRMKIPTFDTAHVGQVVSLILLTLAFSQHLPQYQRFVGNPPVNHDGWKALCWARTHLKADETYIAATYGSVGSFLPACAGLATSAWQIHHCAMEETQALLQQMSPTHRLCVHGVDVVPLPTGHVVFQNNTVTIFEVNLPHKARRPATQTQH